MRFILVILFSLVLVLPAEAVDRRINTSYPPLGFVESGPTDPPVVADYYIATTGSDSNPGTFLSPFATLAHAYSVGGSGKVYMLRGGEYGPWNCLEPPTASTTSSYPGEDVTIWGTNTVGHGCEGGWADPVFFVKSDNVTINGEGGHDWYMTIQGGWTASITVGRETTSPHTANFEFRGIFFDNSDETREVHSDDNLGVIWIHKSSGTGLIENVYIKEVDGMVDGRNPALAVGIISWGGAGNFDIKNVSITGSTGFGIRDKHGSPTATARSITDSYIWNNEHQIDMDSPVYTFRRNYLSGTSGQWGFRFNHSAGSCVTPFPASGSTVGNNTWAGQANLWYQPYSACPPGNPTPPCYTEYFTTEGTNAGSQWESDCGEDGTGVALSAVGSQAEKTIEGR